MMHPKHNSGKSPYDPEKVKRLTGEFLANPSVAPDEKHIGESVVRHNGMTLRDYFAGQALAGLLSSGHNGFGDHTDFDPPRVSYEIADAMLQARGKSDE